MTPTHGRAVRRPGARPRTARLAGLLLAGTLAAAACSAPEEADPGGTGPTPSGPAGTATSPGGSPAGAPRLVGTVASGLAVPWGLAFLPDGTAIATERDSRRVLRLTPGADGAEARITELGVIEEAAPEGEAGLLGVAVSPGFAADRTLFLYATTEADNRVVRVTLDGDSLGEPETILDGIPRGFIHDGGRLAFGPDGHLYVSTGETGEPELAQDPASLAGKILRITTDGDPAPGNPDPGSPVWSLGHRNVQGLAFDGAGRLWASEFGDDTFDELNLVRRGGNYGWPEVEGTGGGPDFVDPVLTWSTAEASPSGLAYLDGELFMAALRGQALWQVPLDGARAGRPRARFVGELGRLRTVVPTPDGELWVATSNRDGRGEPGPDDDRILLVRP